MRHAATQGLLSRSDVIIVASVSCIYGIGSAETYEGLLIEINKGEELRRDHLLRRLVDIQYQRNDTDPARGKTASVDSGRTRTDDGFTRATKITNPQGETATRDLTVSRDTEARTVTRESNYTTFDGRDGSKSDVIQRTEDGFSRDLTRTLANGETHTRSVDVSCEKSVGKCVKQVEVDQQPSGE
jgi:hypothetical protein